MAVTDLTNTWWIIMPSISGRQNFTKNITFKAPHADSISVTRTQFQVQSYMSPKYIRYYTTTSSYTEVYSNAWSRVEYRLIHITGGNDVKDSTLIDWLDNQAVQVSQEIPSTLVGTNWYFNSTYLEVEDGTVTYNLNFTSDYNTRNYTKLETSINGTIKYYYTTSSSVTARNSSGWTSELHKTIHITGGTDASSKRALYFLLSSAEQVSSKVTISYSTAHGTAPSSKEVDAGYALTSADLPTLSATGWRFTGWDKAAGYVVNENTTITASWIQQRTITYSTAHGTAPSSKIVDTGYSLTQVDLPTLDDVENWHFLGWDKSVGYTVNADTTITAQWEYVITYEITYSTTHGSVEPKRRVENFVLTREELPILSHEGSIFNGWTLDSEPIDVGYVLTSDIDLVADWYEIPTYTIRYSTEHGSVPTKTVLEGYELTEDDLPALSHEDYLFAGWYLNGSRAEVGYEVLSNIMLTARWVVKPEPYVEPEIDWHGNRSDEQFIFRKVSWNNWQEHDSYNYITRGSIEYATDAELKVTSSFDFEGFEIPDTNDLIRVYYKFSDGNVAKENPIATLFVSYATINFIETVSGMKASGQLNGLSVLSVLKNKKIGRPYTIKRGTNVVYAAEDLVKECGLLVNTEPTVFVLKSDYTFDSEASYLDIVNFLLSAAGYVGAYPDENGVVQFRKINSEAGRKIEFINNEKSIMYPEISQENDWQNTPNVVKLLYNTDEACVVAYANNVSGSRASLSNRGNREITYVDEVSDVGEGSVATLLKQKAEELLKEKSCDIEYVKFRHAFVPMMLYDSTTIKYGDREWSGTMDNFSVDLSPAVETTSKVKRSLQQDIVISSGSTIYRGA